MATDKNITMKQFNGTDYDVLYPKTIASQIPDVYSKSYIDSILKDSTRIQTGSYVGTGTYGENNPCTLTFDFVPSVVFIGNTTTIENECVLPYIWGCHKIYYYIDDRFNYSDSTTVSGKTMSWYKNAGAGRYQLNDSGSTYKYIAIG